MSYGEKKKKDMIESVLPATRDAARGARKGFRRVSRRERRKVSTAIQREFKRNARADEVISAYDDSAFDWNHDEDIKKRRLMWERRDADNLAALFRWAPSQVNDVRREDRISKMYSLLPDNTIGRHAVGHLEYLDDFEIPHPHRYVYWRSTPEERERERFIEYVETVKKLENIVECGYLNEFNRLAQPTVREHKYITSEEVQAIRRDPSDFRYVYYDRGEHSYYYVDDIPRRLKGWFDIEDFLAEIDWNYLNRPKINEAFDALTDRIRRAKLGTKEKGTDSQ